MLAWLVVSLVSGTLGVSGDSQCPSAAEVQRALTELGLPTSVGAQHQVILTEDRDSITAALLDSTKRLLAERSFPRDPRCRELGAAIAVVISLWETELAAQPYAASLAPPPPVPAASPLRAAQRRHPHFELGGGLLISVSGGPAAAATLLLALRDTSDAWGGILSANWQDSRTLVVAADQASWQRLSLGLGLVRRFALRWGAIEAEAGGELGVLNAHGTDFSTNLGGSLVDSAARLGARVVFGRERGQAWVGSWVLFWGDLQLRPKETDAGSTVPRWELLAGAGVSYDLF